MKARLTKLVVASVCLSALALASAVAQKGGIHGSHAQGHHVDAGSLATLLNATPQQIKQIETIRQEYVKAKDSVKSSQLGKDEMLAKLKKLRADAEAALAKVLDEQQINHLAHGGGLGILLGEDAGGPWAMLHKLNLTSEQWAQVKVIVDEAQQAMEDAKKNPSLKKDEAKARMQEIHIGAMHKVAAILTPEQLKQLHEMLAAVGHLDHVIPPSGG